MPNGPPAQPDHPQPNPPDDVTLLLHAASAGDPAAPGRLFELIYDNLRAIAARRLAGERAGHTLQATALVNEMYLKLIRRDDVQWQDRSHFFRAAADAMRKILIDHARARNADKRGGGKAALSISNVADLADDRDPSGFLALDDAMMRLEKVDAQAASVVRLRFYAGLGVDDVAGVLGLSSRTVRRDWAFARAWLRDTLEREDQ